MGDYTVFLTIIDERNGEIVGESKKIELEDNSIPEYGIEEIEEFVSVATTRYEEDYGL